MNRRALVLFVIVVLVAAVATAWFFGGMAGIAYALILSLSHAPPEFMFVVALWSAGTGLIAGVIWCFWVVPQAVRSAGCGVGRRGAAAGACVGLLSAILLHGGLIAATGALDPFILLVGLICGAGAGTIVGAVCGWACGQVVQRGSNTEQTPEKAEHA